MIRKITLKISGQVQGVFFRAEAQKQAIALGLVGLSQNLPNGTVGIEAEGEEEDLKKLIEWAETGPELAKVEKIETFWNEPTGNLTDFQVK